MNEERYPATHGFYIIQLRSLQKNYHEISVLPYEIDDPVDVF